VNIQVYLNILQVLPSFVNFEVGRFRNYFFLYIVYIYIWRKTLEKKIFGTRYKKQTTNTLANYFRTFEMH
jgi:hypothetical protein